MLLTRRIAIASAASAAALVGGAHAWRSFLGPPADRLSITIGDFDGFVSGLVRYAHESGIMAEHGLDVTLAPYPSGYDAVAALLAGEVELATGTDWVVMRAALQDPDIRAISEVAGYALTSLIARRDHGVERVGDLRGRAIAYQFGTAHDLLAPRFLAANGVSESEVRFVDRKLPDLGAALAAGDVSAIVSWGVYSTPILEKLGARAVAFPMEHHAASRFLLASRASTVSARPKAVRRVIASLVEALERSERDPQSFRAAMMETYGLSAAVADDVLPRVFYNVGLGQALVSMLEDRARFAAARGLAPQGGQPNGLAMIDTRPLRAAAPSLVSVIE